MGNPLFDTLFRPTAEPLTPSRAPGTGRPGTAAAEPHRPAGPGAPADHTSGPGAPDEHPGAHVTPVPHSVSAAPVRAKGVHTRAGNAMSRTRAALLRGAAQVVEAGGTRIAMAQVATVSGVAKATLYNHFRTREAVLAALLMAQVQAVADAQEGKDLTDALTDAALAVARNPVRRGLARVEPATLAAIGCIDDTAEPWQYARAAVAAALARAGRDGTDTVLRWLASYLLTPAGEAAVRRDAQILVAGLPPTAGGTAAPGATPGAVTTAAPTAVVSGPPTGAPADPSAVTTRTA